MIYKHLRKPAFLAILVAAATGCSTAPSSTDSSTTPPTLAGAGACSALATVALPNTRIDTAEHIAAGEFQMSSGFGAPPGVAETGFSNLPAFCRVSATLTPSADSDIKVEVWLPLDSWNGRLAAVGNGVWAGSISYFQMGEPLSRGYITVATDTGHVGNGMDALWAVGHPEKMVDFGHRAVHEMTVTAKTLSAEFYGNTPDYSLWASCSTGGRQGLMAAHRYPDDFDAISAMAPANPMTDLMTQSLWTGYQALQSSKHRLTPAHLGAVHQAFVQQCDAIDGVEDGLVSHPRQCDFDPGVLQCEAGDGQNCLTEPQVDTMRAVYGGVVNPSTGETTFGGFAPGSEQQLVALMMGPEPFMAATSYMRDMVFQDSDWDFRSFDYDQDSQLATEAWGDVLDVPADGLDDFFAGGGKLILSHGWQDGLIPAGNTVNFYNDLVSHVDDRTAEQQLRLFMIPGMGHCSGGEGPFVFDALGLVDDLAQGAAMPDKLIVSNPPGAPERTRPLCPYPEVAVYTGQGSTDDANNFTCRQL